MEIILWLIRNYDNILLSKNDVGLMCWFMLARVKHCWVLMYIPFFQDVFAASTYAFIIVYSSLNFDVVNCPYND